MILNFLNFLSFLDLLFFFACFKNCTNHAASNVGTGFLGFGGSLPPPAPPKEGKAARVLVAMFSETGAGQAWKH